MRPMPPSGIALSAAAVQPAGSNGAPHTQSQAQSQQAHSQAHLQAQQQQQQQQQQQVPHSSKRAHSQPASLGPSSAPSPASKQHASSNNSQQQMTANSSKPRPSQNHASLGARAHPASKLAGKVGPHKQSCADQQLGHSATVFPQQQQQQRLLLLEGDDKQLETNCDESSGPEDVDCSCSSSSDCFEEQHSASSQLEQPLLATLPPGQLANQLHLHPQQPQSGHHHSHHSHQHHHGHLAHRQHSAALYKQQEFYQNPPAAAHHYAHQYAHRYAPQPAGHLLPLEGPPPKLDDPCAFMALGAEPPPANTGQPPQSAPARFPAHDNFHIPPAPPLSPAGPPPQSAAGQRALLGHASLPLGPHAVQSARLKQQVLERAPLVRHSTYTAGSDTITDHSLCVGYQHQNHPQQPQHQQQQHAGHQPHSSATLSPPASRRPPNRQPDPYGHPHGQAYTLDSRTGAGSHFAEPQLWEGAPNAERLLYGGHTSQAGHNKRPSAKQGGATSGRKQRQHFRSNTDLGARHGQQPRTDLQPAEGQGGGRAGGQTKRQHQRNDREPSPPAADSQPAESRTVGQVGASSASASALAGGPPAPRQQAEAAGVGAVGAGGLGAQTVPSLASAATAAYFAPPTPLGATPFAYRPSSALSSGTTGAGYHLFTGVSPFESLAAGAPSRPAPPVVSSHRTNSPWMRLSSIILTPIGLVIIMFIVVSPLLHYLM